MIGFFFDFFLIGFPLLVAWKEKKLGKPVSLRKIRNAFGWLGFNYCSLERLVFSTLVLFVGMLVVSVLVDFVLTFLGINDIAIAHRRLTALKGMPFLLFYVFAVRIPAEEVFFRGLLVKKFNVLLPALVFGLMHASYGSIAEIIGAFALGLLLSEAFLVNKTIYPNILAHCLYNFVVLILYV